MKRIVDLEAHILPAFEAGVGPQTVVESVTMVRELATAGITDVFCTPRVTVSNMDTVAETISQGVRDLQQILDEQAMGMNLHTGALVELCDDMISYLLEHKQLFTLGDSHFMLVTVPTETKVHHMESWLKTLIHHGITPIVSQVESQNALFQNPERLLEWVDTGVLFSIHISSFQERSNYYKQALELYKNGLIHFLGSGYHSAEHQVHHYFETIAKLDSQYKQDLLGNVELNERDLLADRNFYPTVPTQWRGSRPNFWTRLFSFAL